jgi:hypothetical protein
MNQDLMSIDKDQRVLDLDTSRFVRDVLFANEATGEYVVLKRNQDGFLILDGAEVLKERKQGRIKVINVNDTFRNVVYKNRAM